MNKNKLQKVFIWKESIYKNNFTCVCGHKLADDDGTLREGVIMDVVHCISICPKCGNIVNKYFFAETDLKPGLYGDIDEHLKSGGNLN